MIFIVTPPGPTITSFTPTSGVAGDAIAITGTNFTDITTVKFNGVPASFMIDSATQITVTVPSGSSSGLIEITTPGGTTKSNIGFTITASGGGSAITVKDEGITLTTAVTSINFVGAGVVVSALDGAVTATIAGTSGSSPGSSDDVVLLMHMNGVNGSTAFTDVKDNPVTAVGNAQISTQQSKFGGSSAFFDGNGDYLSIPDNDNWCFENKDFTIECFLFFASLPSSTKTSMIVTQDGVSGQRGFGFYHYGNNNLYFDSTTDGYNITQRSAPYSPTLNTWNHIAVSRSGSFLRFFVNGNQIGITHNINTELLANVSQPLNIGGRAAGTVNTWFHGYIDELRITKGTGRYTTNFTPPVAPFPDS